MHQITRIAAAVLLTLALGGLGAVGPAQAQAPAICLTLAPGSYEIDVPELAGNPAGTLIATIGEGGELLTLVEPGGVDLVAIGAVAGLLPLYSPHLPDGVAPTECPWQSEAISLPSTGSGGLLTSSGGPGASPAALVLTVSLGCAALSLLTLLALRRRDEQRNG